VSVSEDWIREVSCMSAYVMLCVCSLVTPSGITSIPAGMETPDMIQLRKKKLEEAMEAG